MTIEELRKLQAAGPELALNAGDACECDDRSWLTVGTGHLPDCANRVRGHTRRRMTPNQVCEAITKVLPDE